MENKVNPNPKANLKLARKKNEKSTKERREAQKQHNQSNEGEKSRPKNCGQKVFFLSERKSRR